MQVFIIVHVNYDYFRFQDNYGVANTIEAARARAKEVAKKIAEDEAYDLKPLPVFEYKADTEHDPVRECCNADKIDHVWIETVELIEE